MKKFLFLLCAMLPVFVWANTPGQDPTQQYEDEEILFFDDFDTLNPTIWSMIPLGQPKWQSFMANSADQAYVKDGKLHLVAEIVDGKTKCGAVWTRDKLHFNNCRIDVCARIVDDFEQASHSIWMMPDSARELYHGWPHCGEIDIMEHTYAHPYVQQTLHSYDIDIAQKTPSGSASYARQQMDGYNIYSVVMSDDEIVFLVNGKETQRYANKKLPDEDLAMQWPFSAPYYLILATSSCDRKEFAPGKSSTMLVDWVKASKLKRKTH